MRATVLHAALAGLAAFLTGAAMAPPAGAQTAAPAQPVTTYALEARSFQRTVDLTGSVELYREEQVGFEVGGRVDFVIDLGKEVEGATSDENGRLLQAGDVIATLNARRYELRVLALEAKLGAEQKQLQAQTIDVERVARADLDSTRAELDIAVSDVRVAESQVTEAGAEVRRTRLDFERQDELRARQSPAFQQKAFDDARAALDAATARLRQREATLASRRRGQDARRAAITAAEATIILKEAEIEATEGRIAELRQDLEAARQDLSDAVLRAPFAGRVTERHVAEGAVVSSGTPIVTLTLMDPVQVRVEVSADMERRIRTGDRARVAPKDPASPDRAPIDVPALVFEKAAVANPATRTFRIDLMVRNARRRLQDVDPSLAGLPVATEFLPVARRYQGEEGPLYVPTDGLLRENGRTYVLRLPGVSFNADASRDALGRHTPEKIEVVLGDAYFDVIRWKFRSLAEPGALREGDFLVFEPRAEQVDGLVIDRPQWLLRPGDLVPVSFNLDATSAGFHVPLDAVQVEGDDRVVFVARDGLAERVEIDVLESQGALQRIRGDGLNAGDAVIVDGAHAVSDGQAVTVTRALDADLDPAPSR